MYPADTLTVILYVFNSPLWYSVNCQLAAYFFSFFVFFCLVLTLISTANGDFAQNDLYQQHQHSTILLTALEVWDRPCCLRKAIPVVTEMNWNQQICLHLIKRVQSMLFHFFTTLDKLLPDRTRTFSCYRFNAFHLRVWGAL